MVELVKLIRLVVFFYENVVFLSDINFKKYVGLLEDMKIKVWDYSV